MRSTARDLTLDSEVARLVSRERDYWTSTLSNASWLPPSAISSTSTINTSIPMPSFGAEEFVERLKRPDSVGAVLQVRCMDLRRADHYVALVPRENGFDIIDSIPHTPDRVLVRGETPRWPATIEAASW